VNVRNPLFYRHNSKYSSATPSNTPRTSAGRYSGKAFFTLGRSRTNARIPYSFLQSNYRQSEKRREETHVVAPSHFK
jgi:hypothetical protein